MSCDCQRSKGAKVSPILECQQAEWNDHKEDSFLMNMPAEQKRRVAAKRDGADECFPCWLDKQFDQSELSNVNSTEKSISTAGQLTNWKSIVNMKVVLGDTFGRTANDESPTRPRVTLLIAA